MMSIGWFARTGADFMVACGGGSLPGGLPIAFRSTQQTTDPGGSLVRCPSGVAAGGVEAERAGHALQLDRPDLSERHRPSLRRIDDLLTSTSPGLAYSAIRAARFTVRPKSSPSWTPPAPRGSRRAPVAGRGARPPLPSQGRLARLGRLLGRPSRRLYRAGLVTLTD
jgi:hypothetical protein